MTSRACLALFALGLQAGVEEVTGRTDSCPSRPPSQEDHSLLQRHSSLPVKALRATDGDGLDETGMHLAFVTDCSSQQRWIAMMMLHSASRVDQGDPITWVRSGCEADRLDGRRDEEQFLRRVYPRASLLDVDPELALLYPRASPAGFFNASLLPDRSWIKPFAFHAFLSGSEISNDMPVALLDPDFIFLERLRVDDLAEHSITGGGRRSWDSSNSAAPPVVEGLHGVAQHYDCCDGAGAPYVFTARAWRELLPGYASLAAEAKGHWGEEQEAFAKAARRAGVTFSVFNHFMISDVSNWLEGWRWVQEHLEASGGGDCGLPGRAAAGLVGRLPTFLHVVRPWNPEGGDTSWQFSKYQVPPGWKHPEGEGILDCDMPLLAEPPAGLVRSASGASARLSAWGLCGIVHSMNHMLTDVKRLKCPNGGNLAKALKIEASWKNRLIPAQSPEGVDAAFVAECAINLNCSQENKLEFLRAPRAASR